jgi:hypothetical protein
MDFSITNNVATPEQAVRTTGLESSCFLYPKYLPRLVEDGDYCYILLSEKLYYEPRLKPIVQLSNYNIISRVELSSHFDVASNITLQIAGRNIAKAQPDGSRFVFDFSKIGHSDLVRCNSEGQRDVCGKFIDVTYSNQRLHFNSASYKIPRYYEITYFSRNGICAEQYYPYEEMVLDCNDPTAWLDFYGDGKGTVKVFLCGKFYKEVAINTRLLWKASEVWQCLGGSASPDMSLLHNEATPKILHADTVDLCRVNRVTIVPQNCKLNYILMAVYKKYHKDTMLLAYNERLAT